MVLSLYPTRRLLFAAAALASAFLDSAHAQSVLNGIAAEVALGPERAVVTFSQVRELVAPKEQQIRQTLQGQVMVEKIKELRLAAINDLIDRTLILQDFKLKGYTIPEYLIDERVQEIIRDSFGGDRQAFRRTLSAQGLTVDQFRTFQRDSVIVQEMRRQATKGVATISEQTLRDYYKQHAVEYGTAEEMKLRMIVIRGGGGGDSRRKMLEEIRSKIADGAEFGVLAHMYDEGGAQDTGGDVGWIGRKHFNESLTKAAFALKPGEMSEVIELSGSYYLLLSEARKQASMKPFNTVRPEIEKVLLQTERQKQQQEWLLKLRKKAFIKVL